MIYNTESSFSVGWIDDNNETLLFESESSKILTITSTNSYFGSIGF